MVSSGNKLRCLIMVFMPSTSHSMAENLLEVTINNNNSVLLVDETGVLGENHRPVASH